MNRILAFLYCLAVLTARAGDWRQFRGPQGSGVSDEANLPIVLDARKNIAWKIPLPGRGLSSPILVGEHLFVTCSSGAQQERLHVICINTADGTKRWERQFWATGRTTCHEKISVAAPTPASDGERIFALFSSNDLICLDLEGNLLWLRGLMRDYPNASNSLGLSSSPVVADGTLVVQAESDGEAFVAGLDALTGINRWKIERPKRVNWTTPLLLRAGNGKQIVALQSAGGITAIESDSGRSIWSYSDGADVIPSSALRGNTLFVPSHGITALQTSPDGQPPKQLWRSNQLRPSTASPLVLDGRIFTLNDAGVLTCGDAATGNRLWQLRLKGPMSATPVAAGRHLYIASEKGLVQVVDPTKAEGELISELNLGETIIGTPSIGQAAIYFRSDGHLWKITKS
jgi:outer membrane protein assembly factor BamB